MSRLWQKRESFNTIVSSLFYFVLNHLNSFSAVIYEPRKRWCAVKFFDFLNADLDVKTSAHDNCHCIFQLGARGFNMTFKEPPGIGNNKPNTLVQWNPNITMYQRTGKITSLYRGIVINESPI